MRLQPCAVVVVVTFSALGADASPRAAASPLAMRRPAGRRRRNKLSRDGTETLWEKAATSRTDGQPAPRTLEVAKDRSEQTGTAEAKAPGAASPAERKVDRGRAKISPPIYKPTASDKFSRWYLNDNYPQQRAWKQPVSAWEQVGHFGANLGLFLLGVASSMALHEITHFLVTSAMGLRFNWPAGGFDGPLLPLWQLDPNATNGQRAAVASAGFIAHAVATEVILWVPQIPKDNLFVLGFLLTSIINNLLYPITDAVNNAVRGNGYGDIQILREVGAQTGQVHIPLILHSLLALARLIFLSDDFSARFNLWSKPRAAGSNVVLLQW